MKRGFLYVALLVVVVVACGFVANGQAQTIKQNSGAAKSFKVFEAWTYPDTPDLRSLDFHKAHLFYESSLTSPVSGSSVREYSPTKITKAAELAKRSASELAVLDLESWGGDEAADAKYLKAIKQFKKANSSSTVGLFGYSPYASYLVYRHFTSGDAANLRRWKHVQKDTLPISNAVDVFMPELYTGGPRLKPWEKAAKFVVAKARSIDPNKPVYVFIWPQYAGNPQDPKKNKNRYSLHFLPPKMWTAELKTLYSIADGVVIWSGYKGPSGKIIKFRKNMPWFVATVKFMKAHDIH